MPSDHSLLPVAHAVAGFLIAYLSILLPILAVLLW
jgi:hypothetical protein